MSTRSHIVDIFGESLVTVMAGKDPADPRLGQVQEIVDLLLLVDSWGGIRAWFMGTDPIDDRNPAELVADGRADEVLAMARTYLEGNQ